MKQKATIAIFFLILMGLLLSLVLLPDQTHSFQERRKLAQMPEISVEGIRLTDYMNELERYLQDQFPGRELFRRAKAEWEYSLLRRGDSKGIYLAGDYAVKMEDELKLDEIAYCAEKIQDIYETYLQGMRVCASVIPDKHYFTAKEFGKPSLDYNLLRQTFQAGLKTVPYVDIFEALSLEDYYRSDAHWKQENLGAVRGVLAQTLGIAQDLPAMEDYSIETLYPFSGVYLGQSALGVKQDPLRYLHSPAIDAAKVHSAELKGELAVYAPEKLEGMDGYDVFLHGAQAFLTIENPTANTDRELVIFRDSFGSSLAPLLLDAYRTITLIDLRYVRSDYLGELIDFEDQDVLFLYSSSIVNSGRLLR